MTNEMIAKAKECKSAEELLTLAKENGIEMTEAEANEKFLQLNSSGELSDDELDSASGGACSGSSDTVEVGMRFKLDSGYRCPACGHEYATVTEKERRAMHGGGITWYHFECENCKNVFSMTSWYGTNSR